MDVFFRKVVELHEFLNTNASINETLKWVFDEFRNYIPCDRIGIALLDNHGGIYSKAVCSEYQPVLPVGYSAVLTRTSLNSVIKNMECRIINNSTFPPNLWMHLEKLILSST